MQHTAATARFLVAIALKGVLWLMATGAAQAGPISDGPIKLDPLCEPPETRNPVLPPGNPAPSTRHMAELLKGIRDKPGQGATMYMSDRMVTLLEGKLETTTNLSEKLELQFQLGIQQTQAGFPDKALNTFIALEQLVAAGGSQFDHRTLIELRMRKAVAFLRLGE